MCVIAVWITNKPNKLSHTLGPFQSETEASEYLILCPPEHKYKIIPIYEPLTEKEMNR